MSFSLAVLPPFSAFSFFAATAMQEQKAQLDPPPHYSSSSSNDSSGWRIENCFNGKTFATTIIKTEERIFYKMVKYFYLASRYSDF
jgi:hypothetical protein